MAPSSRINMPAVSERSSPRSGTGGPFRGFDGPSVAICLLSMIRKKGRGRLFRKQADERQCLVTNTIIARQQGEGRHHSRHAAGPFGRPFRPFDEPIRRLGSSQAGRHRGRGRATRSPRRRTVSNTFNATSFQQSPATPSALQPWMYGGRLPPHPEPETG